MYEKETFRKIAEIGKANTELKSEPVELKDISRLKAWVKALPGLVNDAKSVLSEVEKIKGELRVNLKESYKDLAEFGARASDLGVDPRSIKEQNQLTGLRKELQEILDKLK